jgi:hypothetical protein
LAFVCVVTDIGNNRNGGDQMTYGGRKRKSMKLVEFIRQVEANGLICVLKTHTHDGKTCAAIQIHTNPDPDSDIWSERAGRMIDWQPINGGSVQCTDHMFDRIAEARSVESRAAHAA